MSQAGVAGLDANDLQAEASGGRGFLRNSENLLMTLVLGLTVILPLLDIVLRWTSVVIPASVPIQSHLTLLICMIGGAIAARDGRLLALSTVTTFLKGRAKNAARLFSGAFAAAITIILTLASLRFVLQTRESGDILAYGFPLWIAQAILPLGFAVIAARLLRHAADSWRWRTAAVLLAGIFLATVWLPIEPAHMVVPALIVLFAATLLGAPVYITLGGAAIILLWGEDTPITMMPIRHYQQVVNASLPAIPLFTLAGYFLAEGGAARRLVRLFQALVGHLRGGPAIATVLVCAFFTSFTGASGVTILALGGLLMPVLIMARYPERNALGLLTGSGSIGLLFPPCLPVILYAIIGNVEINRMFLGGLLPGILLVIAASLWGISCSPRQEGSAKKLFSWVEARNSLWDAKWELLLPAVAVGALFSGYATPVEASAITAFYAFVVEAFVYRDLKLTTDVPRVMTECGLLVGAILLILGVALGFTGYLINAQVPSFLISWFQSTVHSKWIFLLALNFFLLIVGCLMDIFSAIVVVVPIIVPIGIAYGIDPVHLGIIFLANLELGYLTPPVGMNLYLSSYRFNKPMPEVVRSIIPILLVLLAGVLLITYVPFMSTALPGWFQ